MHWHTKCDTPFQKQARKALRACVRELRMARSIDVTKVDAATAFNVRASITVYERIEVDFNNAKADADLQRTMRQAERLLADPSDAQMRPQ